MQQAIDIAALPVLNGATVAILRSKWYAEIVAGMHARCVEVLHDHGVEDIETHFLPGCFEFPFAADALLHSRSYIDAVICLGVVLKGDTRHFEMIVDECVRGLGAVSRKHQVPIVNEVLPVMDIVQAQERAADDDRNKGIEAAAAALEIIHWRRQLG